MLNSCLQTVFDIYFVSPVVSVDRRFSALDALEGESLSVAADRKPPADRLVLIVGELTFLDFLHDEHAQHT